MSKALYCDACQEIMYRTLSGTILQPARWRFNEYDFCSERCLKEYLVTEVLMEDIKANHGNLTGLVKW